VVGFQEARYTGILLLETLTVSHGLVRKEHHAEHSENHWEKTTKTSYWQAVAVPIMGRLF
jgi:hypothetical protein